MPGTKTEQKPFLEKKLKRQGAFSGVSHKGESNNWTKQ